MPNRLSKRTNASALTILGWISFLLLMLNGLVGTKVFAQSNSGVGPTQNFSLKRPPGFRPKGIRPDYERWHDYMKVRQYSENSVVTGGHDTYDALSRELTMTQLSGEWRPAYQGNDGWFTQLLKIWFPEKYLSQHPLYKLKQQEAAAADHASYLGTITTDPKIAEERTAKLSREYQGTITEDPSKIARKNAKAQSEYDGTIRFKNAYKRSGDSKSKFRVLPKPRYDPKEKGLWYD